MSYRGRFAPSPTGALHFGSLLTAVASFIDAKANHGQWLVRIENTDYPRNVKQADVDILQTLEKFGLHADGEIVYQLDRLDLYENALSDLQEKGFIYGCGCSRKVLNLSLPYPKTCLHAELSLENNAVRLIVPDQKMTFTDQIQGEHVENLAHHTGDFVLKRRDGIFSYQLAVVVDDYLQGVTHIVRGADLLDNTLRQQYLRDCLYSTENNAVDGLSYAHLPLAMNENGTKLSKQNLAQALDIETPEVYLWQCLQALGQTEVVKDTVDNMLKQAISVWNLSDVPREMQLQGVFK